MVRERPLTYFLYPSGIFIGWEQQVIVTLLGSCVAVCFWDEKRKVGGMNHYMLPYWNGEGLESPRYGNIAITQLSQKMRDFGSRKEDIVCKIFGGAEVLSEQQSLFHVGQRNVELAFRLVEELGIPVVSSSTGGTSGRRIYFNTTNGEVLQQYLVKNLNR
jgi:chemotaxis protein CheD